MSRRKKEEEFDIDEYDTNLYRLCLMDGDWYNAQAFFPRAVDRVPAEAFRVLVRTGRKKRGPMDTNVELSKETRAQLEERAAAGCVSCRYILDDWKANNKLTDYGNFPAEAKINHIEAEKAGQV